MIGYGATCGAHQATIDALEGYDGDEDVVAILERNMPVADTWGRVAVFDAIRACNADAGTATTNVPPSEEKRRG